MELKVPLVVARPAPRLVRASIPTLGDLERVGPSLAALKDELRLAVMERFIREAPERFSRYQVAPLAWIEQVPVATVVLDPKTRERWEVGAPLAVLVEKYPAEDFFVVTPTRLPQLRFATRRGPGLGSDSSLRDALVNRVCQWCQEHRVRSLEPWSSPCREQLEILEVDAYPPPIFPATLPAAKGRRRSIPQPTPPAETEREETEAEREERQRVTRLSVRALREVAKNLSHAAADETLDRAFGRDAVVDALVDAFAARRGVAVVLVGPSGIGKSAVVHEFVRRLQGWHTKLGSRRDVWRVDGNRFIAGMSHVGQWESRAQTMVHELTGTGDVLYLDDLASAIEAGRTCKAKTNLAQFLTPHLGRGELTIIAESSPERLAWAREESPAFTRLFRVVELAAMDERTTLVTLLATLRDLEDERAAAQAPPRIAPTVLAGVLSLTRRFQPMAAFPGKAVRLLRAVLDRPGAVTTAKDGTPERRFDHSDVLAAMRQRTGLPDFILDDEAALPRSEIHARLAMQVAGQPEAVDVLADLVVALQQVLCDPEKPVGSFLFVGPTGVGKTESARALARLVFGDERRLVRFDMSEFETPWSVTRLIGHPGSPEGELTTALRVQPFCVVLFDEVEKAHPRVFDALLQLLGEGRISDAAGRLADARQAVVVLTSNLGVREAASRAGFARGAADEVRQHYLTAAQQFFRPEFFNRIDRVVPFRPLDHAALRMVVERLLAALLSRRGIVRSQVLVDVEPELLDALVEQAYDPRYGARPLKRAMESRLTVPLAHHLLRRPHGHLALVSMYRLGNEMHLGLRPLDDVPTVAPRERIPESLGDVRELLAEMHARFDALQLHEVVPPMQQRRTETLRAIARGEQVDVCTEVFLLERLTEIRDALGAAEDDPLLGEGFVEEPVPNDVQAYVWLRSLHGRPKQGFIEVPTQANEEAVLRQARTNALPLRRRIACLATQLDSVPRGEDLRSVLLEPLQGVEATATIRELLQALPRALGHARAWVERPGSTPSWHELDLDAPEAEDGRWSRVLVALRGFAFADHLDPLAGWAFAERGSDEARQRVLVRVRVVPGELGPAEVAVLDAAAREARARRARGEPYALDEVPDRVTLRWREHRWIDLATGLDARAHEAILAARREVP